MLDRRLFLISSAASVFPSFSGFDRAEAQTPAQERLIRIAYEARAETIGQNTSSQDKTGTVSPPKSNVFRMVDLDAPSPTPLPVFRVKMGEAMRIEVENRLQQPASFRMHGLRGPNEVDGTSGLTEQPIAPGSSRVIRVNAVQPGVFILGSLIAGQLAEQNGRGLTGLLIIEEPSPAPLDADLVLAVSDWRSDEKGQLVADFLNPLDVARSGRLGNRLLSNGLPAPAQIDARPGARLRVRIVNLCNARMMPLTVQGMKAEVIAIDSTPCTPFDPLKRTVILAPGSRYEMRLDLPPEAGQTCAILARLGDGIPLFTVKTVGAALVERPKSPPLPDPGLPPGIRLQDAQRVDVTITGGLTREQSGLPLAEINRLFPDPRLVYRINGQSGGYAGKPIASLKRGRVLVLALSNQTAWPQVMAVHGHVFRLLHPFDDGWDPYFLDTLYLAPGTVARIALIADYPGKWALRSTIAEYYDGGVACWYEVLPT